jgi:hypothetical protein
MSVPPEEGRSTADVGRHQYGDALMADPLICRRLDAGIAKADALGAKIRAIYLTEIDRALLTRWWSHRWRRKLGSSAVFHPCAYRDHPVRPGKKTIIYTEHGVGVTVPRRA